MQTSNRTCNASSPYKKKQNINIIVVTVNQAEMYGLIIIKNMVTLQHIHYDPLIFLENRFSHLIFPKIATIIVILLLFPTVQQ